MVDFCIVVDESINPDSCSRTESFSVLSQFASLALVLSVYVTSFNTKTNVVTTILNPFSFADASCSNAKNLFIEKIYSA